MALIAAACTGPSTPSSPSTAGTDPAYVAQVDAWHNERLADLKSDKGWLTLVGLAWLDENGSYDVGSEASDAVTLPRGPADVGVLKRLGDTVVFDAAAGSPATLGGKPAVGSVDLHTDAHPTGASAVEVEGATFHLIDRAGRIGVRIKDPQSPARASFTSVPRYPVDADWKITASMTPHPSPTTVGIPTVIGTTLEEPSPGLLRFERGGTAYELTPIESKAGLFVVFGDATNGAPDGTYGGGRFLMIPWDGKADTVDIDFNKAISPPCAFTAHATCPLPPAQNKLTLAVPAGEKAMPGGPPVH